MMFAKVEAGKEVARFNGLDDEGSTALNQNGH